MESKTDPADLYQISLLIDQLRHDDSQMRINATKNLYQIAQALGPERTRDELIPFLNESMDDEDDVLLSIAENIAEIRHFVGGSEYYYLLLEPIELLAVVEEGSVRDASVKAVGLIVDGMPDADLVTHYVPFVIGLAQKDWFTSRISSTSLFHIAYKRLPSNIQKEFREIYAKLCIDDTPMVRRMAAQNFGEFALKLTPREVQEELLPAFKKLAVDEQDSVRIQVVSICISLTQIFPLEVKMSEVLPVVLGIASDRSWRVRWSLAVKLFQVAQGMGSQVANNSLCECFEEMLRDQEAEVRSAAAGQIHHIASLVRKDIILGRLLPIINHIITDTSDHTRASCASVINHLSSLLGKEDTVENLLPMLLQLLRDESSDVRLNVIANLDAISSVIGVDLLSQSLLPAIVDLAEDSKWRVRFAIIEHIPHIANQLGCQFFNEKLNNLCMTWLGDDIYSIRRAATDNLSQLSKQFGEEWTSEHIIPRLDRMHLHTNYLQRMTSLYGLQVLFNSLSSQTIEETVLPLVLSMATDPVPNVRLTVARTIQEMIKIHGKDIRLSALTGAITPTLVKLCQDNDRDVRFYANKASEEVLSVTKGSQ